MQRVTLAERENDDGETVPHEWIDVNEQAAKRIQEIAMSENLTFGDALVSYVEDSFVEDSDDGDDGDDGDD